ncbi:DUF751 family protein [Gloeocapsa sp. PCC 73106]|uniref:DUF751 family protein n=1 Tax=Gloeocapsa sp. PCC 73106 TaxID=102232 RepID=UPI0002ABECB6|nr:DUF751 family protein [Gloeocapsa sp. PCC 73106]ELR99261.1 Protein of unknown function (DUF751) [Gloeocapsa sp. PCC 73106]
MQEFFENVSRYPRYLISLILGIFIAFFERLKPFFENPLSAIALTAALVASLAFLFFTMRAMLGFSVV